MAWVFGGAANDDDDGGGGGGGKEDDAWDLAEGAMGGEKNSCFQFPCMTKVDPGSGRKASALYAAA